MVHHVVLHHSHLWQDRRGHFNLLRSIIHTTNILEELHKHLWRWFIFPTLFCHHILHHFHHIFSTSRYFHSFLLPPYFISHSSTGPGNARVGPFLVSIKGLYYSEGNFFCFIFIYNYFSWLIILNWLLQFSFFTCLLFPCLVWGSWFPVNSWFLGINLKHHFVCSVCNLPGTVIACSVELWDIIMRYTSNIL